MQPHIAKIQAALGDHSKACRLLEAQIFAGTLTAQEKEKHHLRLQTLFQEISPSVKALAENVRERAQKLEERVSTKVRSSIVGLPVPAIVKDQAAQLLLKHMPETLEIHEIRGLASEIATVEQSESLLRAIQRLDALESGFPDA